MGEGTGPTAAPRADTVRVIGVLEGAQRAGAGPDVELVKLLATLDGTEASITRPLSTLLADADPH